MSQSSTQFIVGRTLSGTGATGILQGSMRITALALHSARRVYMEGVNAVIMGTALLAPSPPLFFGFVNHLADMLIDPI